MDLLKDVLLLICGAIILAAAILMMLQMYRLVLLDAKSRGIQHPKFWAILSAGSQNGGGLIFYLLKRENYLSRMSTEERQKADHLLNSVIGCFLISMIGALAFVACIIFIK